MQYGPAHGGPRIRSALVYPAILVVSGFAAVLLVFVFVVPQFANLLDDADELPLLAEAVLRTGVWFNESGWLLAPVLAARRGGGSAVLSRQAGRPAARPGLPCRPAGPRELALRVGYRPVGIPS